MKLVRSIIAAALVLTVLPMASAHAATPVYSPATYVIEPNTNLDNSALGGAPQFSVGDSGEMRSTWELGLNDGWDFRLTVTGVAGANSIRCSAYVRDSAFPGQILSVFDGGSTSEYAFTVLSPGHTTVIYGRFESADRGYANLRLGLTCLRSFNDYELGIDTKLLAPSTPVTPIDPTVATTCGPDNDTITPATTTGITYTVSTWTSNTATVTATLNDGYSWPTSLPIGWTVNPDRKATAEFTVTDTNATCPIPVTPINPTVTTICGPDNDTITPATTTGITYTVTTWTSNTATITATLHDGYIWTPTLPVGWTINPDRKTTAEFTATDANSACPVPVTPVDPRFSRTCGPDNTIIPATTEGLTYAVSAWAHNTATVTATLTEGHVWPTTLPTGWTLNPDNTARRTLTCSVGLPQTGSEPSLPMTIASVVFAFAGMMLMRVGRPSRRAR